MQVNKKTPSVSSINPEISDEKKDKKERGVKFNKNILSIIGIVVIIVIVYILAYYTYISVLKDTNSKEVKTPLVVDKPELLVSPTPAADSWQEYSFNSLTIQYPPQGFVREDPDLNIYYPLDNAEGSVILNISSTTTEYTSTEEYSNTSGLQGSLEEINNIIYFVSNGETSDFSTYSLVREGELYTLSFNHSEEEVSEEVVLRASSKILEILNKISFNGTDNTGASLECVVAGCSGELCVDKENADNIYSSCVYKEEYACYDLTECEVQQNGECGWTITEEVQSCLGESSDTE